MDQRSHVLTYASTLVSACSYLPDLAEEGLVSKAVGRKPEIPTAGQRDCCAKDLCCSTFVMVTRYSTYDPLSLFAYVHPHLSSSPC